MTGDPRSPGDSGPTDRTGGRAADPQLLERALREASQGTMTAPVLEVLRIAIKKLGYPGTGAQALRELHQTGRYTITWAGGKLGPIIRPRS